MTSQKDYLTLLRIDGFQHAQDCMLRAIKDGEVEHAVYMYKQLIMWIRHFDKG